MTASARRYRAVEAVSGPGRAAQVLLLATIAAQLWLMAAVADQRTLLDKLENDLRSVTLTEARRADDHADHVALITLLVLFLCAVAFAVWFWRVRSVAGEYDPAAQRRSQPWAFWGWICPVVNLWFPYQIAADAANSVPGRKPVTITMVRLWWIVWLVAVVVDRYDALRDDPRTLQELHSQTSRQLVSAVLSIVAAVLAIFVVELLSRRLDNFRKQRVNLAGRS